MVSGGPRVQGAALSHNVLVIARWPKVTCRVSVLDTFKFLLIIATVVTVK